MKTFNLPDLGEGLTDAEIREWFVKVGDEVKTDQTMVSMETAKAVVDVPAPWSGKIVELHGKEGDVILTGAPLVTFEGSGKREDTGTVVGKLQSETAVLKEEMKIIKSSSQHGATVKAPPAVKALASRLGVDLTHIKGSGTHGVITVQDVQRHRQHETPVGEGFEALRGSRRIMAQTMSLSNTQVAPVSIFDDADIHAWGEHEDITVRLIHALVTACRQEPALNASFDMNTPARKLNDAIHLGLAVDSTEGLFVPVIHHVEKLVQSPQALRETLNTYKKEIKDRSIAPEKLTGGTITLSNFGTFAGRYATPIVVPPQVAIIGCGAKREAVVADDGKPAVHTVLPISLTFDHRAITGGESTRFLKAFIDDLQRPSVS